MIERKELKKAARKNLKKHIIFFTIICAIAAFMGAEFKGTMYLSFANEDHTFESIVKSIEEKGFEKTKEDILNYEKEVKDNESSIVGRTNGIFATSINAISTGSLYIVGFSVLKNIANSSTSLLVIIIILALLVYFTAWFYIVNVFQVIERRIFLEGITYKKIPFRRIAFLYKARKWNNVSRAMFRKWIYESLWNLTIIGGFIKRYSYIMVPFILAENPSVSGKDAILLSRNMMKGHKFEAFKIELSFLGWDFLGLLTYGISSIIYSNPYCLATFSEYYKVIRSVAKENNIEKCEFLNDTYLYEAADSELINEEYKDVIEIMNQKDYIVAAENRFKFNIMDFLGIHRHSEEETKYEKQQLKEFVVDEYSPVIEKETYPFRLFTIKPKDRKHRIESLNYMRRYSLYSLIYIFFIISFIGWLWEVILYLINDGIFVNRGTLHGPWLPIYGGGSLLILLFLSKFRKNILLEFILAVVLCGCVEYFTAWQLETMHGGVKWWDYSGYFLNLHGRICAEGLLTFGFGGLAMVYFVAPLIDSKIRKLNKKVLGVIAAILITIFAIDLVYSQKNPNSGKGINDYTTSKVVETTKHI